MSVSRREGCFVSLTYPSLMGHIRQTFNEMIFYVMSHFFKLCIRVGICCYTKKNFLYNYRAIFL